MSKTLALALAGALATLAACAAEPENQANGTCKLSCSTPRVGSSTYKYKMLGPTGGLASMQCIANFNGNALAPAAGPVQVRFQVFEYQQKSFPSDDYGSGNQGPLPKSGEVPPDDSGDDPSPKGDRPYTWVEPVSGVGFEPVLYGDRDVSKTTGEFKTGNDSVSAFKYAGVVTPSSEWCSDSCGIVTYEFWPDCRQGGTTQVQAGVAIAGGASPEGNDGFFNFSFTNN